MLTNHVFGIDLGSSMVKIYSQKNNQIVKERNMIAVRNKKDVLAVGDEAYTMFEKNPPNVEVASPMANGMIANLGHLEIALQTMLVRADHNPGRHPVLYFAVPFNMTEIEKRAYYSVAQRGSLRQSRVLLVEKPIADALALGIPIIKSRGSMIVNIGSATTEISVLADSRVIISKIIPMGGDQFSLDIMNSIRRNLNFAISMRTANRLKASLADLGQDKKIATKVVGMDCVSGLPREKVITSALINESMMASVRNIAEEIRVFLERTPPQIQKLILKEGIYLTGGSTKVPNIDRIISEYTGHPILLSQYYDLCTVYGLKEIITHDALHHWAFTPRLRK